MSEGDVLEGDDPTLIAIVASAHGYYVDDFNEESLATDRIVLPPRPMTHPGWNYVWPVVDTMSVYEAWHDAIYGFVEAA